MAFLSNPFDLKIPNVPPSVEAALNKQQANMGLGNSLSAYATNSSGTTITYMGTPVAPNVVRKTVEYSVEVIMKSGEVFSVEVENDGHPSNAIWWDSKYLRVDDKYGGSHFFNVNEYSVIKILTMEGKIAQVQKALEADDERKV